VLAVPQTQLIRVECGSATCADVDAGDNTNDADLIAKDPKVHRVWKAPYKRPPRVAKNQRKVQRTLNDARQRRFNRIQELAAKS
jgi:hypothetical protein